MMIIWRLRHRAVTIASSAPLHAMPGTGRRQWIGALRVRAAASTLAAAHHRAYHRAHQPTYCCVASPFFFPSGGTEAQLQLRITLACNSISKNAAPSSHCGNTCTLCIGTASGEASSRN
eukprot:5229533-Pleurochrysis_carterae.AAC.6